jgi:peptide deformylase
MNQEFNYDMSVLKYPHPILKQKAINVTVFNECLKKCAYAMFRTMFDARGIGLAANQVGLLERIIIIHGKIVCGTNSWKTYINPEIISSEGEFTYKEGCLSFPGIYLDIKRAKKINLKYFDVEGKEYNETIESNENNILAQVIQHEIEHLNGVCLIDHMTTGYRMLHENKLRKLEKAYRKGR